MRSTMLARCLPLVAGTFLAASCLAADIKLTVKPAFDASPSGVAPLIAEISNDGPDAGGMISVDSPSGSIQTPVELPRGSRKRVFVYPRWEFGNLMVSLFTNRGTFRKQMEDTAPRVWGRTAVAVISDNPGQLSFLSMVKGNSRTLQDAGQFTALNCTIEDAPPRMVGYKDIRAVVLSDGAERLSDPQVDAIKGFLQAGGTVMLIGGASSPVVDDPRWAGILPVENTRVEVRPRGSWLGSIDARGLPESLTVRTGQLRSNASAFNTPLLTARPYGLGRLYYVAVNPFDRAYAKWEGRVGLMLRALRYAQSARSELFVQAYSSTIAQSGGSVSTPWLGGGPETNSPFTIKLPPLTNVLWILVAYFFCVVPLNFLVLKKMKRGELAWITAPILAIAFAGALFAQARGLYNQGLSVTTDGVLAVGDGTPDGIFLGKAQMFFPTGGSYDLAMGQVESLGSRASASGMFGGGETIPSTDTGDRFVIQSLPVSNLAFREFELTERVQDAQAWLSVKRSGSTVTVKNNSPYKIEGLRVATSNSQADLAALEVGATKSITLTKKNERKTEWQGDPTMLLTGTQNVIVWGQITGLRVGPTIGSVPSGMGRVTLAYIGGGNAR